MRFRSLHQEVCNRVDVTVAVHAALQPPRQRRSVCHARQRRSRLVIARCIHTDLRQPDGGSHRHEKGRQGGEARKIGRLNQAGAPQLQDHPNAQSSVVAYEVDWEGTRLAGPLLHDGLPVGEQQQGRAGVLVPHLPQQVGGHLAPVAQVLQEGMHPLQYSTPSR